MEGYFAFLNGDVEGQNYRVGSVRCNFRGIKGGKKMITTRESLAVVMIALVLVTYSFSFAQRVIYGTVKEFDAHTGKIIIHTDTGEQTLYLEKSTTIYFKTEQSPRNRPFLYSNLGKGTVVKIITVGDTVRAIFVMEVPK